MCAKILEAAGKLNVDEYNFFLRGGIVSQRLLDAVLFSFVPWPSLIRGLATPWTYFLHLSLSSVILTDSSTESPVHDLMLSIQAVHGLRRLRVPGIVSYIISFCMQFPCFLMV